MHRKKWTTEELNQDMVRMQIIARCPRCMSQWILPSETADTRQVCPTCRRLFKVPHLSEIPKAASVIRQAQGTLFVDQEGKTYG